MHEYAADTAWQLHCISKDELLSVVSAHPVLCHERSGESQGYWWSFVMIEDEVRLLDSEIPSFEVTARWESFASALDKSNALTFFELKQMHMEEEMSMSEAYHLKGRGPADGSPTVKSVQTPLRNCALCVFFSISQTQTGIHGNCLHTQGPETVLHQPMRCGQKSCQATHYYNFVGHQDQLAGSQPGRVYLHDRQHRVPCILHSLSRCSAIQRLLKQSRHRLVPKERTMGRRPRAC